MAWVPGAWEIPLAASRFARSGGCAAVLCLGAVIRGETTHDQHINRQVSLSLGRLALESGVPVSFGVLTCNSLEQAIHRAGGNVGNKGVNARKRLWRWQACRANSPDRRGSAARLRRREMPVRLRV